MSFQIAIDGPVASGKSTVAKQLADKLKFLYIDTGAMYRAVALAATQQHISWDDEPKISALTKSIRIELKRPWGPKRDGRTVTVYLNNQDVSWDIRTQEIAEGASVVSQYKLVRQTLVRLQQKYAKTQSVVMEGRDICLRVLPRAQIKIFMTADVEKRVDWKLAQLKSYGHQVNRDEVRSGLLKRDEREMNRSIDPLKPVKDAWIINTSSLNVNEIVAIIAAEVASLRRDSNL